MTYDVAQRSAGPAFAKLGIMQGRLVPPEPDRFQSFPRARWADEFALAARVPLCYIEWIYDAYGADMNPLTHDLAALRREIDASGVALRSMCADYFMDFPLVRCNEEERRERQQLLHELLERSATIGIGRIVIPFVDASRIETPDDIANVCAALREALPVAHRTGVELHLETSLDPAGFRALLDLVDDPFVKVNYDSGNSSSLGYAPAEEFAAYGHRIGSIHIKDRVLGGGTVELGTGSTDFPAVFAGMRAISYRGDITLQVARPPDGDEVGWAQKNRAFVERYWPLE